jgi:hypothetical protein
VVYYDIRELFPINQTNYHLKIVTYYQDLGENFKIIPPPIFPLSHAPASSPQPPIHFPSTNINSCSQSTRKNLQHPSLIYSLPHENNNNNSKNPKSSVSSKPNTSHATTLQISNSNSNPHFTCNGLGNKI